MSVKEARTKIIQTLCSQDEPKPFNINEDWLEEKELDYANVEKALLKLEWDDYVSYYPVFEGLYVKPTRSWLMQHRDEECN